MYIYAYLFLLVLTKVWGHARTCEDVVRGEFEVKVLPSKESIHEANELKNELILTKIITEFEHHLGKTEAKTHSHTLPPLFISPPASPSLLSLYFCATYPIHLIFIRAKAQLGRSESTLEQRCLFREDSCHPDRGVEGETDRVTEFNQLRTSREDRTKLLDL